MDTRKTKTLYMLYRLASYLRHRHSNEPSVLASLGYILELYHAIVFQTPLPKRYFYVSELRRLVAISKQSNIPDIHQFMLSFCAWLARFAPRVSSHGEPTTPNPATV